MTNKKNSSAIQRRLIPTYIFLIIVSFISVFPLYWMIAAATNRSVDVARGKITFGSYALENFQNLTSQTDLWGALFPLCDRTDSRCTFYLLFGRIWF